MLNNEKKEAHAHVGFMAAFENRNSAEEMVWQIDDFESEDAGKSD